MTDVGSAVAGTGFMIAVSCMAIALALVFVGMTIKEYLKFLKEKTN